MESRPEHREVRGDPPAVPGGSAQAYADAVLAVAELIPPARVLTYGDIAELLESGGPRQVGRTMASSVRDVPWWRVLRAGGHPPRGLALLARCHYDDEGTPLHLPAGADPGRYRVDLLAARWLPSPVDELRLTRLRASLARSGQ